MAIPSVKEDKQIKVAGADPKTSLMVGHDGTNFRLVQVDANGKIAVNQDLSLGVEIDGQAITNRRCNCASNGANTLVSVGAGHYIKLYKALLSVNADITGEVKILIGSTEVGGIYNPKTGGQYCLMSAFPDYEQGADGDDLICNLPSATSVTINASYEVI